ncbi:protein asteroid homolog 1-like [Lingula anatina]|uniref:Protein asteroid homolog 1-like n=1 Tax=Lingula anatina TaxID=7574 RepID=A0A1S3H2E5_LINAN|nr:protein asteroid homolog 1-like [Lingula anatina]|eukprot:XP_013379314.1 protein asteroid homolog 1-like [Lingula anatina]
MGIHGLSSFIQDNPHLLQEHKLHDTKIIIDGNNLYHFLHYNYRIPYHCGGDYDTFAKNIRDFFNTLRTCNISPVVVFDGGYESDDRKLRTTLRRSQERIHLAGFISQGMRGKILPILAYEVFRDVLVELDISHLTCDFEADDQIAALANEWNCPVVSNDSDFYVFDVHCGYIPFDHIDLNVQVYNEPDVDSDGGHGMLGGCVDASREEKECKYLRARIYRVHNFLQHFSCTHTVALPVLAALLGNDFVDSRVFETFFAQVPLPKGSKHDFFTNKRHSKIIGLMLWMKNFSTVERITNQLLPHIQKDKRDKVTEIIKKSVENYTNPTTKLADFFSSPVEKELGHLLTYDQCILPAWFAEQFRFSRVPKLMLNAVSLHRIFLLAQVEDMKQSSSYTCSRKLRQIIYGLLLTHDKNCNKEITESTQTNDINKGANKEISITKSTEDVMTNEKLVKDSSDNDKDVSSVAYIVEYDRENKSQRKILVEPMFEIPQYGPLPSLSSIPALSCQERRDLLVSSLQQTGIERLDEVAEMFQLVLRAMVFWIMNAHPRVTQLHVSVLLVTLIKLAVIDLTCIRAGLKELPQIKQPKGKGKRVAQSKVQKSRTSPPLSTDACVYVDSLEMDIKLTTLRTAQERLHKFMAAPQHSTAHPFSSTVIHGFAQYQTCLQAVTYLNQLLVEPFHKIHPALIFNGTFAYNFYQELKVRPNPDLFISETLGRAGPISEFYFELSEKVLSSLPIVGYFQHVSQMSAKKSKKKAPKKKAGEEKMLMNQDSDSEERSKTPDVEKKRVKYADVENKFSSLVIDDDDDDSDIDLI